MRSSANSHAVPRDVHDGLPLETQDPKRKDVLATLPLEIKLLIIGRLAIDDRRGLGIAPGKLDLAHPRIRAVDASLASRIAMRRPAGSGASTSSLFSDIVMLGARLQYKIYLGFTVLLVGSRVTTRTTVWMDGIQGRSEFLLPIIESRRVRLHRISR
jgi:hypothetical protein